MKFKHLLATLLGVAAINVAVAGPYCAPPAACDKCPVECCPDSQGNIEVGYATDYIFRGVRLAEDVVFADVNYTFDACCVPITIGAKHVTGLSSHQTGLGGVNGPWPGVLTGTDGDHTDLYARIGLPCFLGFDAWLGYNHYFYANQRGPSGVAGTGFVGDSHGAVSLNLSREIACGLIANYNVAYDFNTPHNYPGILGPVAGDDGGSWIHDISLSKSFCISDCIGLNITGGVLLTDGVWDRDWTGNGAGFVAPHERSRSSGWNSYYINAELPIAISECATLVPYIGYNGSPDAWIADGVNGDLNGPTNDNDVLHGGASIRVKF